MSAPHIIIDNLPSLCQKLSHLMEVWHSYNENNFACFFETRCILSLLWQVTTTTPLVMTLIVRDIYT